MDFNNLAGGEEADFTTLKAENDADMAVGFGFSDEQTWVHARENFDTETICLTRVTSKYKHCTDFTNIYLEGSSSSILKLSSEGLQK